MGAKPSSTAAVQNPTKRKRSNTQASTYAARQEPSTRMTKVISTPTQVYM